MEITLGTGDSVHCHQYLRWTVRLYFKRASGDQITIKPWIFPHSGNFRPSRLVVPGTPATRSVGCPDGFLSMIFGFLGKFRIDIAKNIFRKNIFSMSFFFSSKIEKILEKIKILRFFQLEKNPKLFF